jgi:hypothetical protein
MRGLGMDLSKLTGPQRRVLRKQKRKSKVRKDFINGIVNTNQLAKIHNVSTQTISIYLREIRDELHSDFLKAGAAELAAAEARLLNVFATAVDGYERSKEESITVTTSTQSAKCRECKGTGSVDDGQCIFCEGSGVIESTETKRRIQGQAGDPNMLRVQVDCVKEINRIRGHGKEDKRTVNVFATAEKVMASVDLSRINEGDMLDALDVMDRLTGNTAPSADSDDVVDVETSDPLASGNGSPGDQTGIPDDVDSDEW